MKCDHGKMPSDMGQLHGRVVPEWSFHVGFERESPSTGFDGATANT
jgi:hypothetical protein